MNDEKDKSVNYIFFLKTKKELSESFYFLAELFNILSINLLPITQEELTMLDRLKRHHLIVLQNDFSSAQLIRQAKKNFLFSSMITGKMIVHDLSSFSPSEDVERFQNKNVYRFYRLPLSLKDLAIAVANDYFKDKSIQAELWPGGRRAKLPTIGLNV